jgi:hypothetical protein
MEKCNDCYMYMRSNPFAMGNRRKVLTVGAQAPQPIRTNLSEVLWREGRGDACHRPALTDRPGKYTLKCDWAAQALQPLIIYHSRPYEVRGKDGEPSQRG